MFTLATATAAKVLFMNRDDLELIDFVRHKIEAWLNEDPDRSAAQLARMAGITATHISTIRSRNRGAGMKTLRGLARAWGMSLAELEEAAKAWARENPRTRVSGRVVEYDERYPNRGKAAAAAQLLGYSASAIREVQSMSLKSDTDLEPDEWLGMIQNADRRLRMVRFPHEEERERQHQEHRAAERAKEDAARGTFEERLARAKAKQQKDQG